MAAGAGRHASRCWPWLSIGIGGSRTVTCWMRTARYARSFATLRPDASDKTFLRPDPPAAQGLELCPWPGARLEPGGLHAARAGTSASPCPFIKRGHSRSLCLPYGHISKVVKYIKAILRRLLPQELLGSEANWTAVLHGNAHEKRHQHGYNAHIFDACLFSHPPTPPSAPYPCALCRNRALPTPAAPSIPSAAELYVVLRRHERISMTQVMQRLKVCTEHGSCVSADTVRHSARACGRARTGVGRAMGVAARPRGCDPAAASRVPSGRRARPDHGRALGPGRHRRAPPACTPRRTLRPPNAPRRP